MAGLCLAIEANGGVGLHRFSEWGGIRGTLQKELGPNWSDSEYLDYLRGLLLKGTKGNVEAMLRIPVADVVGLIEKADAADSKTDNFKKNPKKIAPNDVNDAARYILEQKKLIADEKRPYAGKKALIREHVGDENESEVERLAKALQPTRYGWILKIADK